MRRSLCRHPKRYHSFLAMWLRWCTNCGAFSTRRMINPPRKTKWSRWTRPTSRHPYRWPGGKR